MTTTKLYSVDDYKRDLADIRGRADSIDARLRVKTKAMGYGPASENLQRRQRRVNHIGWTMLDILGKNIGQPVDQKWAPLTQPERHLRRLEQIRLGIFV